MSATVNPSRKRQPQAKVSQPAPTPPAPAAAAVTVSAPATALELGPVATIAAGFGRIPVSAVSPVIEGGAYAAKAVVGELVPIRAKVFREGHDAVNASVILTAPDGREQRVDMTPVEPRGLDPWEAWVRLDTEGAWTFRVEGWSDPWETWLHNAEAKLPAGVDIDLVCLEGRDLLDRTAAAAEKAGDPVEASILKATAMLLIPERPATDLLEVATAKGITRAMEQYGPRDMVSPTADYPLFADRAKALYSSWYEFFPRSQGAVFDELAKTWASGTFDSCHDRLEQVAAMGFDVIYLPPIHPIGTSFRKGRNNTLIPAATDPGSPWAIGSPDGGHDAIHPELGDWEAFDRFVAKANDVGLEVALDFALQASPDHPWVTSHPEWFTTRLDGTIAYAENLEEVPGHLSDQLRQRPREGLCRGAPGHAGLDRPGVKIFRVDNPHTKPLPFWHWLIATVRTAHPEVIFLAEAFTRPSMMFELAKVGFNQSYTYFTWRNSAQELTSYLTELAEPARARVFRPNFFVNTPDILHEYLQHGGPPAFHARLVLAATLGPSYGIYSGFENFENTPVRVGSEEYMNSEKYALKHRRLDGPLLSVFRRLNIARRTHAALQRITPVRFVQTENEQLIAYVRGETADPVICVVNLDPYAEQVGLVHLDAVGDLPELFQVADQLNDQIYQWRRGTNYVALRPGDAHVLALYR